MKNAKEFLLPIYNDRLVLITSMEAGRVYYKKKGYDFDEEVGTGNMEEFHGFTQRLDDRKGKSVFVVAVFDGKLETLVHEIAHLSFDICSGRGIEFEEFKANEAYCYLIGYLFSIFEKHVG